MRAGRHEQVYHSTNDMALTRLLNVYVAYGCDYCRMPWNTRVALFLNSDAFGGKHWSTLGSLMAKATSKMIYHCTDPPNRAPSATSRCTAPAIFPTLFSIGYIPKPIPP